MVPETSAWVFAEVIVEPETGDPPGKLARSVERVPALALSSVASRDVLFSPVRGATREN